jgi:hypothetical protein
MSRLVQRAAWIVFFTLLSATPALANQPPGPGVGLPQTLMLPMMALFTALGGGYAILRGENKTRSQKVVKWIAIVGLFVFGFTHEGASLMVTVLFGAATIYRGARMIRWGMRSEESSVTPGVRTRPWRLIAAGTTMSLMALYLIGSAVVFVSYWPDAYQHMQIDDLKKILAAEIAHGRAQKQQTGETRFYPIKPREDRDHYEENLLRHGNVRVDFSPDEKHFTVFILPYSAFPPWPYRFWTKQGSYRADESGQIRMIQVQRQDQVCPADAPVVMKVEEADISEAVERANTPQ